MFAATIVPGPPSLLFPGDVSGATTTRSPTRNVGGAAAGAGAGATRSVFLDGAAMTRREASLSESVVRSSVSHLTTTSSAPVFG